jgi:hypothetical protein
MKPSEQQAQELFTLITICQEWSKYFLDRTQDGINLKEFVVHTQASQQLLFNLTKYFYELSSKYDEIVQFSNRINDSLNPN